MKNEEEKRLESFADLASKVVAFLALKYLPSLRKLVTKISGPETWATVKTTIIEITIIEINEESNQKCEGSILADPSQNSNGENGPVEKIG